MCEGQGQAFLLKENTIKVYTQHQSRKKAQFLGMLLGVMWMTYRENLPVRKKQVPFWKYVLQRSPQNHLICVYKHMTAEELFFFLHSEVVKVVELVGSSSLALVGPVSLIYFKM